MTGSRGKTIAHRPTGSADPSSPDARNDDLRWALHEKPGAHPIREKPPATAIRSIPEIACFVSGEPMKSRSRV